MKNSVLRFYTFFRQPIRPDVVRWSLRPVAARTTLLFTTFLVTRLPAWAQVDAAADTLPAPIITQLTGVVVPRTRIDTAYIATYRNQLHVHLLSVERGHSVQLLGQNRRLIYKPNGASAFGFGLAYRWFGADLTLPIPFIDKIDPNRGRTRQFGVTANVAGRRVWFNSNYQRYQGLYIRNPEVIDAAWFRQTSLFPQRRDLRSESSLTRLHYNFNSRRFSNPASLFQQERQKRSAGALLVGASLVFTRLRADSSLIPARIRPVFPIDANTVQYRSFSYSLNVGYLYTFVFARYGFLTLSLRPGAALNTVSNRTADNTLRRLPVQLGWQGDGRAVLGFNSDYYYGGASYQLAFFSDNFARGSVRSYHSYVRLLVGRRFDFRPRGLLRRVPGF